MPKYSIIIPVCNNQQLTRDCLDSIAKHTLNYEVIIVDNGSTPAWSGIQKIIRNETNLGFPVAVNQGIKAATGEVIVILNNDTIVTPHWLDYIDEHLKNFDIVGPCTNSISGPQQVPFDSSTDEKYLNSFAKIFHAKNVGKVRPYHRLVFYCVAIKREVINKIGLLDEIFTPGNFEDDDYCMRAVEAGFKLGIVEDVFILHLGSATHKSLSLDKKKLIATNQAKFEQKWPREKYLELEKKALFNSAIAPVKNPFSVALVMVVKDEEKGLEHAILSCRDFVDEIVISVDKTSTDNTLEIAKKYATILKIHDFRNDFSAIRNFAHKGVKSQWILFLDGHEFVQNRGDLKTALDSSADGLLVDVQLENGYMFRSVRFYRNGVKFVGAWHEKADCKNVLIFPYFLVKHDRLESQNPEAMEARRKQSDEMVPKIMGAELKKDKKNIRALFHLGGFYQGRGEFKKAIYYWRHYLKYTVNPQERWLVYFDYSICELALNHLFRAYWFANKAEQEMPNRWETEKLQGDICFQAKKYRQALEHFVASFKVNGMDTAYKPLGVDQSATWNLIGECFFHLLKFDEAGISFKRAADLCNHPQSKVFLKDRSKLMEKMLAYTFTAK